MASYKSRQKKQGQKVDDFRNLPIIPTVNDIFDEPCIRPNIVKGKYLSVEHYLDIQFRLLREDFMGPLRENIYEYFKSFDNFLNRKVLENNVSLGIYNNFRLLHPDILDNKTIIHVATFDAAPFKGINWESSKIFLPGSLLCFSDDDFRSFHVATVVKSDIAMLKKGVLNLKLENFSFDLLSVTLSKTFVMIEAPAYYEAYQHNLLALCNLHKNNFPMKEYILNLSRSIKHPSYLTHETIYDLGPLICDTELNGRKGRPYYVPILQYDKWPSAKLLGLEKSQYAALQSGITKEFSIIQGPPGTGKTFIGLKIVQTLLHNSVSNETPILIVCKTNHALDQFLEGIVKHTSDIARIGSRSASETINKFTLRQLRESSKRKSSKIINALYKQLETLISEIKLCINVLKTSATQMLDEDALQQYILPRHWQSLNSGAMAVLRGVKINKLKGLVLQLWLDLSNATEIQNILKNNTAAAGWRTQQAKAKRYEYRSRLDSARAMTANEVSSVRDVWKLPYHERWSLYKYWMHLHVQPAVQRFVRLKELNGIYAKLQEAWVEENMSILHNRSIIGATCTGVAKNRILLKRLNPQIIIFEEAAEVLEAHIITSLTKNVKHVILIGDHQQLRPSPSSYKLTKKYNFDVSLFERMVKNGMDCHQLIIQHRMRPCIAALLVPYIYKSLKNHESVLKYDNIKGVRENLFFIDHKFHEYQNFDSKSHANLYEAKFIVKLCRYFLLQGYKANQITVLTTYSGQLVKLQELMKDKMYTGVRVTVVDNYQGEENEIVLVSFVRSNENGKIGFLETSNRVCVALSRARKGLFCIGNFNLLAQKSQLWQSITNSLLRRSAIGRSLHVTCQNHPETTTLIQSIEDFGKVPDGGCSLKCQFCLPCGHICTKKCHPNDIRHLEFKCEEKVAFMSPCGHKINTTCHLTSNPAKVRELCRVPCKAKLTCGHICKGNCGKCYVNTKQTNEGVISHILCTEKCRELLSCGHQCTKKCNEECADCMLPRTITFSCGHESIVMCSEGASQICRKPCNDTLDCGHKCVGFCYVCKNGKNHLKCQIKILHRFACGHKQRLTCGTQHISKCHAVCEKKLPCGHKCKQKCFEPCSTICFEPATMLKNCGHLQSSSCYKMKNTECDECQLQHSIRNFKNLSLKSNSSSSSDEYCKIF